MRTYGQFCPVAKAAEIFAERWTPLIVRELIAGSRRFHEIEQGVPRIPRSLLVQRLRALEDAGIVERHPLPGRKVEYQLTQSGQELTPVVQCLGEWGQRWVNHDVLEDEVDSSLLMWDMRRRINLDRLPPRRVVVQFDFRGAERATYWLILGGDETEVCLHDPGFEVDLFVDTDSLALHRVWIGRLDIGEAIRQGSITVHGRRDLARAFPSWLALGQFAGIR